MELMKGADSFSFENPSEIGILLIHGFTSTPDSMRYLGEAFAKAGYNVECPLHPGHGTQWQDLNKVKYQDWLDGLEKSLDVLKKRCKKIYVSGLSMGGTCALRMAQLHPELSGVVLVNHAVFLGNPAVYLLSVLKYILKSTPAIGNDIKDPDKKELAYPKSPTGGVHELHKLTKVVKKGLSKINQPTIIFKSKDDHVLPLKNAPYTLENISSDKKELVWLENSYHVATMDFDKDIIVEKTIEWIKQTA